MTTPPNPFAAPPGYGPPPQAHGYPSCGVPVPQSTNGLAIAPLVCGIAGCFFLLVVLAAGVGGAFVESGEF